MRVERSNSAPSAEMWTCEMCAQVGRAMSMLKRKLIAYTTQHDAGEAREVDIAMEMAPAQLRQHGQWLVIQAYQTERSQLVPEKLLFCT